MQSNFNKAALSYFGLAETRAEVTDVVSDQGEIGLVIRLPLTDEDVVGIADRMKAMREQVAPEPSVPPEWFGPAVAYARMRDEYNGMDKRSKSEFGSFHRYKAWRLGQAMDATIAGKVELPAHVYLSPVEVTEQQKVMAIGRDERGKYAIAVEDLTEAQRIEHVPGYEGSLGGGLPAEQTGWLPARLVPEEQRKTALSERYVQATEAGPIAGVRWFLLDRMEMTAEQLALCKGKPEPTQQIGPSGVTADQLRQAYVERTMAARERLNGADGKPTSNADDFGGLPG